MGIGHLFRHKRFFFFTVMCCALVWIAMLSVGFSCCAVVNLDAGREGGMLMVQDPDPPFAPVKVAADFASDETSSQNIHGKKLLQDTSSWEEFKHNMELQLGSEHEQKMLSADKTLRYEVQGELQNLADIPATEQAQVERNVNQDSTNSGTIQRTVAAGTKKIPQAIIIGVKKGGTRALLEFLRIHPDVRAPGPETHFFDRYYHKGLQWYRKQMPPTLDGQMTIEKTPSYFITKEVPRRIFSMSPNIKLIVVVRDPVTRAISDYTQAASKRPGMKPFEHMAFLDNYTGLVNTSWGAIRIGVYAKHLDKWLKYFPLSQMHFVSGERLITDPAGEMGRVQDFLGLKRVISEKHFYFNETKGFPCLKKTEGSGRPHCLGKSKGRQHPKVGPRLLQRLRDFFRPFNAKFYQMVGQDFGWP